jgi:O-succinylbenzoate synthase
MSAFLSSDISLRSLSLLEISLPFADEFRSAIGRRRERRALLVRWTDLDGAWGIGECSCRPDPYYSGEFVDGAVAVIRDHVFPRLPVHGTLQDVTAVLSRVRGWNFTVAALLDALFDRQRRKGLPDPLVATSLPASTAVPVGISLGLFDRVDEAVERVAGAVDAGFRRVKLKVDPRMKMATLTAIRSEFPEISLSFDANGSIEREDYQFVESLQRLEPLHLEQPFAPRRLDLTIALKLQLPDLRICLDESVDGLGDLITAHRLGALDELNIKPGRVGGQLAVLQLLEYCARHAIPTWVGGMFETGIGRFANLRVAARIPDAVAHDLNPPAGYLTADVVRRPLEMSRDGLIEVGDESPVAVDEDALERFSVRRIDLVKKNDRR